MRRREEFFNPFAKDLPAMKRRRDEEMKMATQKVSHNTPLILQQGAISARSAWNLWNDGFPVLRIVNHGPHSERGYSFTFQQSPQRVFLSSKDSGTTTDASNHPTPSELLPFLVDLLRLEKKGIAGKYGLACMDYHYDFERKYFGSKFWMIPLFDHQGEAMFEPTDLLDIAKTAACLAMPEKRRSLLRCQSIKAIIARIPPLPFRVDSSTMSTGTLLINTSEDPINIWLSHEGTTRRVTANAHGRWLISRTPEDHASGIEINLDITPYPEPRDVNPLLEFGLKWQKKARIWFDGEKKMTVRNLLATLGAEELHAQNSAFNYEIVEQDLKKKMATVRLERRDGEGNAHDLWELALQNKEMDVALNSQHSVFDWAHGDVWSMEAVDEQDPYILKIRSADERKIPQKGILKHASVAHRSLMMRKMNMIRNGTQKSSILEMENPVLVSDLSSEFRLTKHQSMMALQGPPGTGKTWTATHIIEDILNKNPSARILVCSKEHLALNHLALRIREQLDSQYDVVRFNSGESESNEEGMSELLPSVMATRVLDELHLPPEMMEEVGKVATWVDELALRTASVVCTTTLDKTMEYIQNRGVVFDYTIIEEAGKCYPSEMIGPVSVSINSLLIGDHMQLPPFELIEIEKTLSGLLEEGIENWTNRNHRKEVSRDMIEITTQFHQREDLDVDAVVEEIRPWLQPFKEIHTLCEGDILRDQWRMFEKLSNAIGSIFYQGPFARKKKDRVSEQTLPGVFGEHKERLLFFDIPDGREMQRNKSLCNPVEAKRAAEVLVELLDLGHEVVALTPYKGQVEEIQKHLKKSNHHLVKTVDGFQGKEADFIILSLVRNNKRTGSSRRWGFFRDPRRINVAFSRAREGMAIISSASHIKQTDWRENEGHLKFFCEFIEQHGHVIGGVS